MRAADLKLLKAQARELSKATGESLCKCLEVIAQKRGFNTYAAYRAELLKGSK